jgi:tetratricopeptide (TPR) repeat protein
MKPKKTAHSRSPAAPKPGVPPWQWQPYAWAGLAIVLVFWAYGPALHGVWVFDDTVLPYARPAFSSHLSDWLQVRPVLMFSYWANKQTAAEGSTYGFHVVNLLIHLLAGGFMFLIVRRFLEWSGAEPARRNLLAGFAAGVFLLHPAMSEAVAYTAGRSESFSAMWTLAAFALFLYRPKPAASWSVAAGVFLLFGVALASKENTVALPALLLLTDFWWNPGFSFKGIRGNWKLYLPMAAGAAAAVVLARGLLTGGSGAGFGIGIAWYQYLFTEFRALLVYIQEFLFPINLTADWHFEFSNGLLDHGAIVALAVWLGLLGAAWHFRKRFPLAAYGLLVYLLLMAPTSSIIPIKDPVAERRLYSSVLGLLLILVDLLSRLPVDRRKLAVGCAAVVLVCTAALHARAAVWADDRSFWTDVVQKAPENYRAHFHLGFSFADEGRWFDAIKEYELAATLEKPNMDLLLDWGIAYLNTGQPELALAKFQESRKIENSAHVWTQIAEAYATMKRFDDALAALAEAQKLDAGFPFLYIDRGKIYKLIGRCAEAVQELQKALQMTSPGDPAQDMARQFLPQAEACASGAH